MSYRDSDASPTAGGDASGRMWISIPAGLGKGSVLGGMGL